MNMNSRSSDSMSSQPRPKEFSDDAAYFKAAFNWAQKENAKLREQLANCTRSHPHENMTVTCELRTEIARLTNQLAHAEALANANCELGWFLTNNEEVNMKTKTVYCLRTRPDDNANWSEPEYYATRKGRDNAASYCRCLGGFRTHSYEEKLPLEAAESACA